jgi:hypothetical protein
MVSAFVRPQPSHANSSNLNQGGGRRIEKPPTRGKLFEKSRHLTNILFLYD